MNAIPVLEELRQEGCHKFKTSLDYMARPYLKTKNNAVIKEMLYWLNDRPKIEKNGMERLAVHQES